MAQLSQLLLFDPDPSGLDTLSYGFEKDGCSVTATADPAKARDLILGANPALVVINLGDSEKIGTELLRSTTSNPRTRNLPCVAIGRESLRGAAMDAGAFVFLSTPLFVRDVLGACRLVAAASVPGSRPSPDAELSLKLAELDGLYFLVRSLAVAGRSTVIELQSATKHGELRFIDGTLTSAQMGSVQGLPALHQMLLWEDASLHFKFKNVVRRGTPLSMKGTEIIEECDRFLRDFAHEAKDLGAARTVYATGGEIIHPSATLPSEVIPVLKLFDGQRDLAQVLDESPFRIFDTLKIIKRFVEEEAIRAKTQAPPRSREMGPTLSGPGALDYWLQKLAPALGAEVGVGIARPPSEDLPQKASGGAPAGRRQNAGFTGTDTNSRPSSPFVAVRGGLTGSDEKATSDGRKRTITRKEHVPNPAAPPIAPEDIVTPPPLVQAAATPPPVMPPVATPLPAMQTPDTPPATLQTAAAPPPVMQTPDTPPAALQATDAPSKPAVARGEIKVAVASSRQTGSMPAEGTPSVLVEIGPLPTTLVPTVATEPAPGGEKTAPPTVIVAHMTPPPTAAERQRKYTPTPGIDAKRNPRSPSDSFNDVEADFFEREADLYKRESVENFEDLDGASRTVRRPNGPSRKG